MIKIGMYGFDDRNEDDSYFYLKEKDNGKVFYQDKEGTKTVNIKNLENWAVVLNSPWSQAHESYTIGFNCKDAYTEMNMSEPIWRCTYTVIGYEGICGIVIGYGNTEEEALEDCKSLFKYLQENFNKDDESF